MQNKLIVGANSIMLFAALVKVWVKRLKANRAARLLCKHTRRKVSTTWVHTYVCYCIQLNCVESFEKNIAFQNKLEAKLQTDEKVYVATNTNIAALVTG